MKKEPRSESSEKEREKDGNDFFWAFNEMIDVSKFFRAYCYRSMVEQGFSLNEIDVLISLKQHPEKNTVKGISETMHLSKGMISQAVESLRKKDMVTVKQSKKDRRSVLIHLSQVAHPVIEKLKESSSNFVERIISGISSEQLHALSGAVSQISKNKARMKKSDTDTSSSEE